MNIFTAPFRCIGWMCRGAWRAMVPPVTVQVVLNKHIADAEKAVITHTAAMEDHKLEADMQKAHADKYARRIKRLRAELAAVEKAK